MQTWCKKRYGNAMTWVPAKSDGHHLHADGIVPVCPQQSRPSNCRWPGQRIQVPGAGGASREEGRARGSGLHRAHVSEVAPTLELHSLCDFCIQTARV